MDLRQLERALACFHQLAPDGIPVHHAMALLRIASEGSCTYRELEEALNLSNASISRTLNTLSEGIRGQTKSLGLVEIYRCPEEGRRYRARLTKKGRALLKVIQDP